MNEEFDPKTYQKSIFTFKPSELAKLTPWDAQIQLGAIAQKVLAGMLRQECLKRVGVKNSPDTKVEYDLVNEQFIAYIPKIWCSDCTIRMGTFEYNKQPYCGDCAEKLRQKMAATPPPSEPTPKKGKKKEK